MPDGHDSPDGRCYLDIMNEPNATITRFYRWNAPIYDLTRWVIHRGRPAAVDALELEPGDRVLEIGCGTGLNFARLQSKVGDTGRIVGVDLSTDMLARARRRQSPNVELICEDASSLALDRQFDGVLLTYALTIIPDWQTAIARAFEHLTGDGRLVVLDFGRTNRALAIHRRLFDWYLALNHVHSDRDIGGELRRHTDRVEILRPTTAYATLLRCRK